MSTYFLGMLLVHIFHSILFYFQVHYMKERLIAFNVYLFHGHVSCLPSSRYTVLRSGTLHVGTSNCFMSTYFTDMLLVYLFHSILFYFLVHYT